MVMQYQIYNFNNNNFSSIYYMINEYLINGPNNVVRLSNGDKILYIFGDYHLPTDYQQECPINDNYESIDLDKLLFKFMKEEKNKEFDLFIEEYEYNFTSDINNTSRQKYIDQVNKLVKAHIIVKNNKILTNKKYNNFRFHYFDIRNTLEFSNKIFDYFDTYFEFPYQISECVKINIYTDDIIKILKFFYKYNKTNKFIIKILYKYENKKIQKIINKIYNEIFIKNLKLAIKNCNELINLINNSIKEIKDDYNNDEKRINIIKDIYIKFTQNKYFLMNLLCLITDLYFLRRFLDKKYITNAIIYTGSAHMTDLIYLLTKYFNYKLTHTYYTNKSLKTSQIIKIETKKFLYIDVLLKYFTNYNKLYQITQCVDLFNFPKNFS
jgi:hypothetical protein